MVISRVIIRVTPFRALITLLITYLLSPLPLQVTLIATLVSRHEVPESWKQSQSKGKSSSSLGIPKPQPVEPSTQGFRGHRGVSENRGYLTLGSL